MLAAASIHSAANKNLVEALRTGISYANILGYAVVLHYREQKIPLVPGDIVDVVLENLCSDYGPSISATLS